MHCHSPLSAPLRVNDEGLFPILAIDSFTGGDGLLSSNMTGNTVDPTLPINSLEYWTHWNPIVSSEFDGVQSLDFRSEDHDSGLVSSSSDGQRSHHTFPASSPASTSGHSTNFLHKVAGMYEDQENSKEFVGHEIWEKGLPPAVTEIAADHYYDSKHITADMSNHHHGDVNIRHLLDLTQSLYLQQTNFEATPWHHCLSSLTFTAGPKLSPLSAEEAAASKPIGDILRNSERFLMIMKSFLASAQNSSQPVPRRRTSDTRICSNLPLNDVKVRDFSVASAVNPSQISHPPQPQIHADAESTTPPKPGNIDTATILLILTCYIRILRIYTTLFTRINEYLSFSSSSARPDGHGANKDLEALYIDGFSLRGYGEIQLKILVEVCVHFIMNIEKTLGVPQKYTLMSDGTDDEILFGDISSSGGGLLMKPQMSILMDVVIKNVESDNHEGGSIREWGTHALRRAFEGAKKHFNPGFLQNDTPS
ncbi:hypothetical protein WAI453_012450 [Rhynchosporium graminicola]